MDVKTGTGAFMREPAEARALARSLVEVARGALLPCVALITEMGQCLGRTAGNALEVAEALALLRGEPGEPRLRAVILALAGEALTLGGLAADARDGAARAAATLADGGAAERFARMVRLLGGPGDLLERPGLPAAPLVRPVPPPHPGIVQAIDARALGLAVVELGGGRRQAGDAVDAAVGLAEVAAVGEAVGPDRPLALVHARSAEGHAAAATRLRHAYIIADQPAAPPPAILERIA